MQTLPILDNCSGRWAEGLEGAWRKQSLDLPLPDATHTSRASSVPRMLQGIDKKDTVPVQKMPLGCFSVYTPPQRVKDHLL